MRLGTVPQCPATPTLPVRRPPLSLRHALGGCSRLLKPQRQARLSRRQQCPARRRRAAAPAPPTTALLSNSGDDMDPALLRHHPVLDAINDATKWGVSAAAFGTLLLRRDVPACWCILGSVVAAFNCRVSKLLWSSRACMSAAGALVRGCLCALFSVLRRLDRGGAPLVAMYQLLRGAEHAKAPEPAHKPDMVSDK